LLVGHFLPIEAYSGMAGLYQKQLIHNVANHRQQKDLNGSLSFCPSASSAPAWMAAII